MYLLCAAHPLQLEKPPDIKLQNKAPPCGLMHSLKWQNLRAETENAPSAGGKEGRI